MNNKNIAAVVLGVALGLTGTLGAQSMAVGNRIHIPTHIEAASTPSAPSEGFMQFQTADGTMTLMQILPDGSVKFHLGATIHFSDQHTAAEAGAHAGFVWVVVGGQHFLMPIFHPRSNDKDRIYRKSEAQ
jgi:hypothetical protein